MIDIKFNYKEKKTKIKCNTAEHVIDVFKRFASENNLDFNNLLFFYEGSKINIDLDLILEDQFDLKEKSKKIKKIKILVFDNVSPNEYFVKFMYNSKDELIKCKNNEKMNIICQRFASKAKADISKILLLYKGEVITKDDLDNKTFDELASKADKESKVMSIVVNDYENRDSVYSNLSKKEKPFGNDKNLDLVDNLIEVQNHENNGNENQVQPINPIDLEEKKYYLKFFLILFIQYGLISFLVWLGFFLNINEKFTKDKSTMLWTFIPITLVIMFSSIIYCTLLEKYKKGKCLYIYHILHVLFIISICFLLSKNYETNYILCTLFIILIEILAMEIYALIFNCFKIYLLGLCSFIFGLLSTIGFYFWIEDIITIIIIYSIGFSFILYLVGIIFYSLKVCKKDEYIYASMICNYSIFFVFASGLKGIFKYIFAKIVNLKNVLDEFVYFNFRMYFLLIIQFIFIIGFVYFGFFLHLNYYLISGSTVMIWIFIISLLILAGMCGILYAFKDESRQNSIWYIYHFLYVVFIIIFSFLLSNFINEKIIISLLSIYALDLIAIEIYILSYKSIEFNLCGFFFSPFFMSLISVILFNVLWIKDNTAAIYISIIAFLNLIYLTALEFYSINHCTKDEYTFAVILFDYAIFCLIFALAICIILFVIYLVESFFSKEN